MKQALLEQRLNGATDGSVSGPEIPRRPDRDSAPLSFAQRQIWVIDQLTPGNPAYNLPAGYRLRGPLDATALEDSFNEIIKRHEGLRTTFAVKDAEPLQLIHPEFKLKLNVTELDHLTRQECETRLQALASEESVKSFDLSRLPLIRASLFKLGKAEHVLIINLHHIVADGLSVGLMLDELDTFYRLFTGAGDPRRPELAVQYADFALWHRQAIASQAYANQVAFWRQKLHGRLPVLEMPGDMPRPVLQSFKGSNVFFNISTALAQDLRSLGAREGCTLFMTLLATFQVLLQRYSGAEEILIGTPFAARPSSDVELLIGNFFNMVALRCDLSGNPTFREVLRRSRETTLDALSNADLPFEMMVEHLTFERDPSRNPLFQVMLQVLPATGGRIDDLQVSSFYFDWKFAQFDLSLHVHTEPGGYLCRFEYCTDLFHADTIERLSANFMQLLSAIVTNPDQRISTMPILTESEKRRVLLDWNNTLPHYPKDRCLHHLFEKTVTTATNRVAIECSGRSLTYGDVNAKANRLANYLIKLGVTPETLVGICLERSVDLIIGLLGVLKAGAAYVPLDPSFPPNRLAYMMEQAGVLVLVTQTDLLQALPQSERTAICLDADDETIQQQDAREPNLLLDPSNLAYTIYTSGSAGQPKGVMIEHQSVVNVLSSMQQKPGFHENDVLVAVTTIAFDIAALEMFLPLISGGKLVIADRNEVVDGSRLLQLLERSSATTLQATPATWKLMIEAGWKRTPGLRMLCGGEALPREIANRMLERGGELWNMYGPTETTIWSSVQRIEPGDGPVLVGPPIANTQFYVVDQELESVPIGVAGELLIGGDGLSRGYLNRPDLTAERFVQNPFPGAGNRVYKTGDLARFRSDGSVELLGRLDSQVKVRGYRIDLGEIEHVLAQHEGVKDVAVVTWDDQDGDKRLVAYYIPVAKNELKADELRQFLREQLPDYMCPSLFEIVETFPLTPNGKVDRNVFPRPNISQREIGSDHAAPDSALEVQLAAIWQSVLKKHPIGVTDSFFDLGGHSLLAAQLFAQIEKKLGVTLPLAILFQAPTIRQLAEKINRKAWTSTWKSLVPIQAHGTRPPLFLIHGAEGNVLLYRNLARKLGNDQPIYGLQARGLDGREPVANTLESMAAKYVEEIASVQPKGPYYLGGYCLGGTVALEIAQQLKRAGESVALLAMFETYNVQSTPPISFPLKAIHKAQSFYFHLRNLLLSLSEGTATFLSEKFTVELDRFTATCDIFRSKLFNQFKPGRLKRQHLPIQVVNDQTQAAYQPGCYDGRIVLFRTKAHYYKFDDWYFGWGTVANQGVQVVELPNYPRGSLNDPFVEVLANKLRAEMEKAVEDMNAF